MDEQYTNEQYDNAAKRVADWRQSHRGDRQPRARGDEPMSQIRFAELATVSVGCVQGLETAARHTRKENLIKIANVLGITVDELMAPERPADQMPAPEDPRLKELRFEDFEIAYWYHHAGADIKSRIRTDLIEHHKRAAVMKTQEALRLPSEATFHDRRSGTDRRTDAAAASDPRRRSEG